MDSSAVLFVAGLTAAVVGIALVVRGALAGKREQAAGAAASKQIFAGLLSLMLGVGLAALSSPPEREQAASEQPAATPAQPSPAPEQHAAEPPPAAPAAPADAHNPQPAEQPKPSTTVEQVCALFAKAMCSDDCATEAGYATVSVCIEANTRECVDSASPKAAGADVDRASLDACVSNVVKAVAQCSQRVELIARCFEQYAASR